MNLCVFCSSSSKLHPDYFTAAFELGRLLALNGHTLVYGGANVGLMGHIAQSVKDSGGKVIGVIPESLKNLEIAFEDADELTITPDMKDRKALMEDKSDAFIALPGGFGTLEEMLEVMTLKQLRYHNKPVVFLNTRNFYNGLFTFFEQIYKEDFAKPDYRKIYYIAQTPEEVLNYVETYNPVELPGKI